VKRACTAHADRTRPVLDWRQVAIDAHPAAMTVPSLRQTDVRRASSLNVPAMGAGHNKLLSSSEKQF